MKRVHEDKSHADISISRNELLSWLGKQLHAQLTCQKSGLSRWEWCTLNPKDHGAGGGQGWLWGLGSVREEEVTSEFSP